MNRIIAIDEWMKEVVHYCSDRYLDSTRNRITNTFKQTIIGIDVVPDKDVYSVMQQVPEIPLIPKWIKDSMIGNKISISDIKQDTYCEQRKKEIRRGEE